MPRPIKQGVDYFPHATGASNGRTMFILESQYGNNGYAFWFKILELLSSSNNHSYDFNAPPDWEFLLAKTRVSADIAKNILNTLSILGAIDGDLYEKNIIWCQNLVDNLEPVYERRKSKLPQKPSKCIQELPPNGDTADINPIESAVSTQSKAKYSKVKESTYTLPDWIKKETWDNFLEMRVKKNVKPTEMAILLLIGKLEKLKCSGNDPNEVLEQSIMNNYTGVFPLKDGHGGTYKDRPRQVPGHADFKEPEDY